MFRAEIVSADECRGWINGSHTIGPKRLRIDYGAPLRLRNQTVRAIRLDTNYATDLASGILERWEVNMRTEATHSTKGGKKFSTRKDLLFNTDVFYSMVRERGWVDEQHVSLGTRAVKFL